MTLEITVEQDRLDIILDGSLYLNAVKEDEDLIRYSKNFGRIEDDRLVEHLKTICRLMLA